MALQLSYRQSFRNWGTFARPAHSPLSSHCNIQTLQSKALHWRALAAAFAGVSPANSQTAIVRSIVRHARLKSRCTHSSIYEATFSRKVDSDRACRISERSKASTRPISGEATSRILPLTTPAVDSRWVCSTEQLN